MLWYQIILLVKQLIVDEPIISGFPVNIIQHPLGERKKISMHNSNLVDISDDQDDSDFCYYTTDTLKVSSGSPVFNKDWEVIALHRCGVPEMEGEQVKLLDDRLITKDKMHLYDKEIRWVSNQGIRITSILKKFREENFAKEDHQKIRNSLFEFWVNS